MHAPVLVAEVVEWIRPRTDGVYVDCTLGLGGHARALIEAGAGRVIGIDRDEATLARARSALADVARQVQGVHDDYRHLPAVLDALGIELVDGVLVDLGVSSVQLDEPARGFSFRHAGPLDMRMDPSRGLSLAERLAVVDTATLADVIWEFGEERRARRVAAAIVSARDRGELTDTVALASAVRRGVGARSWQRIDPATRTFQALRIWVNDELLGLDTFLESALARLVVTGRLVVIAFQSLEDRIVKHTMRRLDRDQAKGRVLTRRPVLPTDAECESNPRARSARLRVIERLA